MQNVTFMQERNVKAVGQDFNLRWFVRGYRLLWSGYFYFDPIRITILDVGAGKGEDVCDQ